MALTGFSNKGGGGSAFTPLSEGVHTARLVQIIDLGIQREEYQGQVSERPKAMFTFEVPGETVTVKGEEKPKFISIELTVSLHEKAKMPAFIKALDSSAVLDENFNLTSLLGKGAQINIGRTAGGKAKILTAMSLAKGQIIQKTDTPLVVFDFDNQDMEVLSSLPEFLKKKIASAVNATASADSGSLPPVM
jgi:hypothetical protein